MLRNRNLHQTSKTEKKSRGSPSSVRLLRNSKYFSREVPERDNNRGILSCPTSKNTFSGTNHSMLAYYLLNDTLQFLCRTAVMRRLLSFAFRACLRLKTTWEKGSTTETPMRHTMAVRMTFKVIIYVFG